MFLSTNGARIAHAWIDCAAAVARPFLVSLLDLPSTTLQSLACHPWGSRHILVHHTLCVCATLPCGFGLFADLVWCVCGARLAGGDSDRRGRNWLGSAAAREQVQGAVGGPGLRSIRVLDCGENVRGS